MDLVCLSHSPLMRHLKPRDERGQRFFDTVASVRKWISERRPELIVVFAPDHFNGFLWDVMPPFCIGLGAATAPDWEIPPGPLNVPKDIAAALVMSVRAAEIDIAVSRRMLVDHGTTIPLYLLVERLDAIPVIPIFTNCAAPPLPSCRRVRLLGEAVGGFFRNQGRRVLVLGSGGLSHDPPHSPFDQLSTEMQEVLVRSKPWRPEHERKRQQRVIAAAYELADRGAGPCLPPDAAWDRRVLEMLKCYNAEELDQLDDDWITRTGGRGGHEIRTWIAAMAAIHAQGATVETEVLSHDIVPEWITGMAVLRASADAD